MNVLTECSECGGMFLWVHYHTPLSYSNIELGQFKETMQKGPQARSADLVHTHSGERVSKYMFKSSFDLPF